MAMNRSAIAALYHSPLLDLIGRAHLVHRAHNDPSQIQVCVLLSVKTGGCPEDCAYCPQSAHYRTAVEAEPLLDRDTVLAAARNARASGATRFCMGAAWREVKNGPAFDRLLEIISAIKAEGGLEVCCTLGMLDSDQAQRLKHAGLDAYNHNLDTSRNHYSSIISTRTYDDRLRTLGHVQDAGIAVCCGGILGLGETHDDRIDLLHTLSQLNPPPESIPINALVPVAGTPLADQPPVPIWDLLRMIATTRILFPTAKVRLSAGRLSLSQTEQALCFLAGANSLFAGDKLLTTPNPDLDADHALFSALGLTPRPADPTASLSSV
ncbi:MAG: biotin synthase [Isosphaeraceae bacterium]|jgi:biotin synthase|nr:MAG: biotin synthase [Isosphaeraceae bacterium]